MSTSKKPPLAWQATSIWALFFYALLLFIGVAIAFWLAPMLGNMASDLLLLVAGVSFLLGVLFILISIVKIALYVRSLLSYLEDKKNS
ncbi:hypothetical protein [Entomospira culicis]|uniref:DUF4282 domain-containing protein n=1 Tax=Entomospira culicis TaxID=2719989 RepID=A0A968GE81_9SPIO|nr:hypothetical protein [Entomospira culicis]NIZ18736.1 hypothetical protein [Entomospira culicis]NIZ68951.1 hypothetical protein [Entomospira culicis]WDI37543.1 hypothetical protein PVA46_01785 [Entomospira culicis]WDI39171.1 hypothetical protein PVA47_01790 [Entomospira culicis]